ncbi:MULTISPECIES: SDR family oxidoreductase [Variovorax]|nr:SDR family oxidoreductase [Variovorax paradoxus]MBW8890873.1 SDR family oxidoreductase [Burkholderiales bacterium]
MACTARCWPVDKPEEISHVALFLASDESSFVTSVDIKVDGVT